MQSSDHESDFLILGNTTCETDDSSSEGPDGCEFVLLPPDELETEESLSEPAAEDDQTEPSVKDHALDDEDEENVDEIPAEPHEEPVPNDDPRLIPDNEEPTEAVPAVIDEAIIEEIGEEIPLICSNFLKTKSMAFGDRAITSTRKTVDVFAIHVDKNIMSVFVFACITASMIGFCLAPLTLGLFANQQLAAQQLDSQYEVMNSNQAKNFTHVILDLRSGCSMPLGVAAVPGAEAHVRDPARRRAELVHKACIPERQAHCRDDSRWSLGADDKKDNLRRSNSNAAHFNNLTSRIGVEEHLVGCIVKGMEARFRRLENIMGVNLEFERLLHKRVRQMRRSKRRSTSLGRKQKLQRVKCARAYTHAKVEAPHAADKSKPEDGLQGLRRNADVSCPFNHSSCYASAIERDASAQSQSPRRSAGLKIRTRSHQHGSSAEIRIDGRRPSLLNRTDRYERAWTQHRPNTSHALHQRKRQEQSHMATQPIRTETLMPESVTEDKREQEKRVSDIIRRMEARLRRLENQEAGSHDRNQWLQQLRQQEHWQPFERQQYERQIEERMERMHLQRLHSMHYAQRMQQNERLLHQARRHRVLLDRGWAAWDQELQQWKHQQRQGKQTQPDLPLAREDSAKSARQSKRRGPWRKEQRPSKTEQSSLRSTREQAPPSTLATQSAERWWQQQRQEKPRSTKDASWQQKWEKQYKMHDQQQRAHAREHHRSPQQKGDQHRVNAHPPRRAAHEAMRHPLAPMPSQAFPTERSSSQLQPMQRQHQQQKLHGKSHSPPQPTPVPWQSREIRYANTQQRKNDAMVQQAPSRAEPSMQPGPSKQRQPQFWPTPHPPPRYQQHPQPVSRLASLERSVQPQAHQNQLQADYTALDIAGLHQHFNAFQNQVEQQLQKIKTEHQLMGLQLQSQNQDLQQSPQTQYTPSSSLKHIDSVVQLLELTKSVGAATPGHQSTALLMNLISAILKRDTKFSDVDLQEMNPTLIEQKDNDLLLDLIDGGAEGEMEEMVDSDTYEVPSYHRLLELLLKVATSKMDAFTIDGEFEEIPGEQNELGFLEDDDEELPIMHFGGSGELDLALRPWGELSDEYDADTDENGNAVVDGMGEGRGIFETAIDGDIDLEDDEANDVL